MVGCKARGDAADLQCIVGMRELGGSLLKSFQETLEDLF